jgi:alanine racemase
MTTDSAPGQSDYKENTMADSLLHSTVPPEPWLPAITPPSSSAWAEIDLDTLTRNYDRLTGMVGADRQIIAPVKANAYGHGAVAVAACLAKRGAYAVQTASVREALEIRQAGNPVKIIAYPVNLAEDVRVLLQNDIVPTVVDVAGARMVSAAASRPTSICVKVDAGLQRLGVPLAQAEDVVMAMAALPNVRVEGLYTHVPFADMRHAGWAKDRIRAFETLARRLTQRGLALRVTQARASAHVLANIGDSLTAVCAGHFLYGLRSFPADSGIALQSAPVLRAVRARLIQVRSVIAGSIGADGDPYGSNFHGVARTGVLAIGRANGIPRPRPDNDAHVLIAGRLARIISVTLEYTVVDLTGHPDVCSGDSATIVGDDAGAVLSIEDAVRAGGSSPLDFCIGLRDLAFRYHESE